MTVVPDAAATPATADAATTWRPSYRIDLHATLGRLGRGAGDPTHRVTADGALWRTALMPSGPATYRLVQLAPDAVAAQAWGPGAAEAVDAVPDLLGARDAPEAFEPRLPALADAHRRHPGLRIPRTGRVLEALVPAILEQKILTVDAHAAWRRLLQRYGERAPGPAPAGMRVPPGPSAWRSIPSWGWHRAGVDGRQVRTVVEAAAVARRVEECAGMTPAEAAHRLCALPGVGPWTAAEVAQRALGDADAISVGDYHLAKEVGRTFTGRPFDDDEMLAFLAPWQPHRYRVVRLLDVGGLWRRERHGHRTPRRDHRAR